MVYNKALNLTSPSDLISFLLLLAHSAPSHSDLSGTYQAFIYFRAFVFTVSSLLLSLPPVQIFTWLTPSFHSGPFSNVPLLEGPSLITLQHTSSCSLPLALVYFSPQHLPPPILFIICLFTLEVKLFKGNKKYLLRVYYVPGPFLGNEDVKVNKHDYPYGIFILVL